jgi:hypothetical protein
VAAPTAPILGFNCKLYRNTSTYESPSWNEIPNCETVEAPIEFTDIEVSSRAGGGWKQHEPGMGDIGFTLTMPVYDPADADYIALLAAAQARTSIDFWMLDQSSGTTGSQGPRARFKCFKFGRTEELDGVCGFYFEYKICYDTNAPAWSTAA